MLYQRDEDGGFAQLDAAAEATYRANPDNMISVIAGVGDVTMAAAEMDEIRAAQASSTAPVPATISDRQFFQQLAVAGIITQDQALASNAAVIPAPLLAVIDALPADQRFSAKMLVSGATIFERKNALTIAIGSAYGWSSDQIDTFFTAAAAL